ncbi:hypothetical protein GCM10009646_13380 [Streptomyces aureus]
MLAVLSGAGVWGDGERGELSGAGQHRRGGPGERLQGPVRGPVGAAGWAKLGSVGLGGVEVKGVTEADDVAVVEEVVLVQRGPECRCCGR